MPADEPYDFSKQLFPALLSRGKHLYGHVLEGYWQDVGNLEQYRQANFDALDGRMRARRCPGIRLRDNVYLGDGVQLPELGQIEGPGLRRQLLQDRGRGADRCLLGARPERGGQGRRPDRAQRDRLRQLHRPERPHRGRDPGQGRGRARRMRWSTRAWRSATSARSASQSVLAPNVKVYPFKTIEAGCRDPLQPDLGVARHHDPVRPRRGERPRQRRHHARRGLSDRDGLRHDAGARRADRGQPRRPPGVAHDQAVADIGLGRDRRQRLRPAGGDAGRGPAPAQDRRAGGRRSRADLAG